MRPHPHVLLTLNVPDPPTEGGEGGVSFTCAPNLLRLRDVNTDCVRGRGAKKAHRQQDASLLEEKQFLLSAGLYSFMDGEGEDADATTSGC